MHAATVESTKSSSPRPRTYAPAPFPTTAALALERMTHAELDVVFLRGEMPDFDQLVGWEFRGINAPAWASLVGIKKFVKGFFRDTDSGRTMGYNCPVVQNVLDGRWHIKPSDNAPRRFGYYEIAPTDPTARDNYYLHSALLDYGKGGNKPWDPTAGIRDYLVQVDPANPDLYLGKAYYALGPMRLHSNFFILERHRRGLTDYARR